MLPLMSTRMVQNTLKLVPWFFTVEVGIEIAGITLFDHKVSHTIHRSFKFEGTDLLY